MAEVQKNILDKSTKHSVSEDEFFSVLKMVAPGTNFRTALNGALKIGNGALFVVENSNTSSLYDGGFRISTRFTPQKVMELCKMDGAIILSRDTKKINYANVLLTPSAKIKTVETGTRHKAAERTANQAGTLVVAISERRNEITLYYKNIRYPLRDTDELLSRASENIQLLEKQKGLFSNSVEKLTHSELKNFFDLKLALSVIQKGRLIQKILDELRKFSIELGDEATMIKIRLKEISLGVDKELDLVIKDYTYLPIKKTKELLLDLSYNQILDEESLAGCLGYENSKITEGSIKGWRILSKTSLSDSEIARILREGENFETVINSPEEFFMSALDDKELGTEVKSQLDKIKDKY